MKTRYYSHGKLLISGEYAVLDGALSLALPTRLGQVLTVQSTEHPGISWTSLDPGGKPWFETAIQPEEILRETREPGYGQDVRGRLLKLLSMARRLNPEFLKGHTGYLVETLLEFPRDWGLGSSSTLINNIAQWAMTDPYVLHEKTFGGSGYDIACAGHNSPILFQRKGSRPEVAEVPFYPEFREALFFVHLNRKQDSREGISAYRSSNKSGPAFIREISALTREMLSATSLEAFASCLDAHEKIVSSVLDMPTVKDRLFQDFGGSIKSLGAWGGDFILATGGANSYPYFEAKGYPTILPYDAMIL